jgi:hypothetical protein
MGRDTVTGADVLVAIFDEKESHAVWLLAEQEMMQQDAANIIAHDSPRVVTEAQHSAGRQKACQEAQQTRGAMNAPVPLAVHHIALTHPTNAHCAFGNVGGWHRRRQAACSPRPPVPDT